MRTIVKVSHRRELPGHSIGYRLLASRSREARARLCRLNRDGNVGNLEKLGIKSFAIKRVRQIAHHPPGGRGKIGEGMESWEHTAIVRRKRKKREREAITGRARKKGERVDVQAVFSFCAS